MKHYNARPSSVSNIGEDITGAARHRNDTYENPEQVRAKAAKKQSKTALKALLEEYKLKFAVALSESTEAGQKCLREYEYRKTLLSCEYFAPYASMVPILAFDIEALRQLVKGETDATIREIKRKAFNALINKQNKIRYMRPIELSKYLEPKTRDSFTEFNGVKTLWQTETKPEAFNATCLASLTKAVQFGNSVPDSERLYCSEKLFEAVGILNKYFSFDITQVGFSFGARGKAGSIAHYQDSAKVLAFNRHWDGALIHELGHAIDYSLGLASHNMPYEIRKAYRAKLESINMPHDKMKYYMNNKEIFARLFEAYCEVTIPELTPFVFTAFDRATLPDLTPESIAWLAQVIQPILKQEVNK